MEEKNNGLFSQFMSLLTGVGGFVLMLFLELNPILAIVVAILTYTGTFLITTPKPSKRSLIEAKLQNGEELIALLDTFKRKLDRMHFHTSKIEDYNVNMASRRMLGILENIYNEFQEDLLNDSKPQKIISNADSRVLIEAKLDDAIRPLEYFDRVEELALTLEERRENKNLVLATLDIMIKQFQTFLSNMFTGQRMILETQKEVLEAQRKNRELFDMKDLEDLALGHEKNQDL